jgi:diaminohydroxyphosphoribosylaminopyrimidine deaminase/5-amino-6-(5-phosphoribosylamino)uracil reductase
MASPFPPELSAVFEVFAAGTPERPFVVAQIGQSLDGRVATASGDSKYINGAAALDHLHRLRAHVDAVVVGVGTVLADDPQLTVRRVTGRSPARVVIDPRGRMPERAQWLVDDGARRCVVRAQGGRGRAPEGLETIEVRCEGGSRLCPREIVVALGRCGFARILVEGGPATISRFLEAGAIDRLHVLVAPVLIGSGRSALDLTPIVNLGDALRPACAVYPLPGGEALFACDLRNPAPGAAG